MAAAAGLALALALALGLGAPAVGAQTRFVWPDTTVDVTKYKTPEECLAAARRIRSGLERRLDRAGRRDTLPIDPQEALRPAPAPVIATSARCAARFPVATANLADFAPLLQLYLDANRDADAKTLVARRLSKVPETAARERIAASDSAVEMYLGARPERLDAAEELLVARARGGADRLDRMELYWRLMNAANGAGDTARARRAARWIVAAADSLTKADRESDKFTTMGESTGGNLVVFGAVQVLVGVQTMLDSLRHSTAAMVNMERNMWARFMNERPEALPLPIGEKAATIAAEYWFPREAGGAPHPAPGRVSVIAFADQADCVRHDENTGEVVDICGFLLSQVRRLSERFPALDVTIVSATRGSFAYAPPPSPAEEATLIQHWIEAYRIPRAAIAVSSTPFWNLPSPDGRRINKPTPNLTAYSFHKSWDPVRIGRYLVDQDGIIVDVLFNQEAVPQFIDVLLQRQKQGGDRAAK